MRTHKFLIILLCFTTSCITLNIRGPLPADDNYYKWHVRNIPDYHNVIYIIHGFYYPDYYFEKTLTFYPGSIIGVFFIYEDKILFTVYNKKTKSYNPYELNSYSSVISASVVDYLNSRIIRIRMKDGSTNSLGFATSFTPDGNKIDNDFVVKNIITSIKNHY